MRQEKVNMKRVVLLGVLVVVQGVLFSGYRAYYYLEYEVDVKCPRVSDFHIYRFR